MSPTRAMTTTSARVKPTKQSSYEVAMTKNRIIINTPKLGQRANEELNRQRSVRIHQRFQSLLVSVIESANFSNFLLTPQPVEAYRPDFEHGGAFCDLVLRRRKTSLNAVLLEVKTRRVPSSDKRRPMEVVSDVLDNMPRLLELQQAARDEDGLWVVAVGMYRPPTAAMAESWCTDFSVGMVWGREVGTGSPHGHYFWESIGALDKAMKGFDKIENFWSLIKSAPPRPPRAAVPPPEPHVELDPSYVVSSTLFEDTSRTLDQNATLEEMVKAAPLGRRYRLALLAVINWPDVPVKTLPRCEPYAEKGACAKYIRDAIPMLAKKGVIKGYRYKVGEQLLSVDREGLIKYLKSL